MIKTSKDLKFPEFDDIKVSTKTFIIMTNINLNLRKLFDFLPITDYTVIPKKRGRKKKIATVDQAVIIESGSIVTMKFENLIKGVELKQKKNLKKKSKWFRNSFTVVIMLDNKPVNFKICQNGVFQITGCKFDRHAEECVKYIWQYIKEEKDIYNFSRENENNLEALFIPAMRNIDFSLGFIVDREKLAKYMTSQTEFHSLLETSFGYTGVNIKSKIEFRIQDMKIKKMSHTSEDGWTEKMTTYAEYLTKLSEKDRLKKLNKQRYNTFLVFHSGRTILSSICADFARDSYNYFVKMIKKSYDQIEERLDV
jgi:TATA-box binding protein (TBP) (component of TFIID and TFIIIB)